MNFKGYKDLKVWQKAVDLVVECYQITLKFPKTETFGLCAQLRRAAVSIPANIAEGHERHYTKEFFHYLSMAYASLAELETHIEISCRLNYITNDQLNFLVNKTSEIGRMLNGLRKALGKKTNP